MCVLAQTRCLDWSRFIPLWIPACKRTPQGDEFLLAVHRDRRRKLQQCHPALHSQESLNTSSTALISCEEASRMVALGPLQVHVNLWYLILTILLEAKGSTKLSCAKCPGQEAPGSQCYWYWTQVLLLGDAPFGCWHPGSWVLFFLRAISRDSCWH